MADLLDKITRLENESRRRSKSTAQKSNAEKVAWWNSFAGHDQRVLLQFRNRMGARVKMHDGKSSGVVPFRYDDNRKPGQCYWHKR
jgi:hypothetical protein